MVSNGRMDVCSAPCSPYVPVAAPLVRLLARFGAPAPQTRLLLMVGLAAWLAACGPPRAPSRDGEDALRGPAQGEFSVPGWDKRAYLLHLPSSYDGSAPIPVLYALHGGGGKALGALRTTCANGDANDESCLTALAEREGFAVVFPNGHPSWLVEDLRTWNAGGGEDGFQCVSGAACKEGIDDLAYFDALFAEVERAVLVDEARVFATGLSNGGAMSHRLACARADKIAAIAPVGAGNQVAAVQGCEPSRPVPVLVIHGTADPCWAMEGGESACLQDDGMAKVGVQESIDGWVARNGCAAAATVEELPDTDPNDGTNTTRTRHGECREGADVAVLLSEGGGHTWPDGWQYLGAAEVGPVVRDYRANEELWAFFAAHPMPASP